MFNATSWSVRYIAQWAKPESLGLGVRLEGQPSNTKPTLKPLNPLLRFRVLPRKAERAEPALADLEAPILRSNFRWEWRAISPFIAMLSGRT